MKKSMQQRSIKNHAKDTQGHSKFRQQWQICLKKIHAGPPPLPPPLPPVTLEGCWLPSHSERESTTSGLFVLSGYWELDATHQVKDLFLLFKQ
jgi:hypothetical protein